MVEVAPEAIALCLQAQRVSVSCATVAHTSQNPHLKNMKKPLFPKKHKVRENSAFDRKGPGEVVRLLALEDLERAHVHVGALLAVPALPPQPQYRFARNEVSKVRCHICQQYRDFQRLAQVTWLSRDLSFKIVSTKTPVSTHSQKHQT